MSGSACHPMTYKIVMIRTSVKREKEEDRR
jgi:hypothetical protein